MLMFSDLSSKTSKSNFGTHFIWSTFYLPSKFIWMSDERPVKNIKQMVKIKKKHPFFGLQCMLYLNSQ